MPEETNGGNAEENRGICLGSFRYFQLEDL